MYSRSSTVKSFHYLAGSKEKRQEDAKMETWDFALSPKTIPTPATSMPQTLKQCFTECQLCSGAAGNPRSLN